MGLSDEHEIRRLAALAMRYRPLAADERAALLQEGRALAAVRGEYYGAPV